MATLLSVASIGLPQNAQIGSSSAMPAVWHAVGRADQRWPGGRLSGGFRRESRRAVSSAALAAEDRAEHAAHDLAPHLPGHALGRGLDRAFAMPAARSRRAEQDLVQQAAGALTRRCACRRAGGL